VRFARTAGPWLVLALLAGCEEVGVPEACARACDLAQWCGLLPSPLGANTPRTGAVANCRERCALTPEREREPILSCLYEPAQEAGVAARWCAPVGAAREAPCAKASACLTSAFPHQPRILGRASVTVVVRGVVPVDTNLAGPSCRDPMCTPDECASGPGARDGDAGAPSCDRRVCSPPADGGVPPCEALGGVRAELMLENGSRRLTSRIDTCSAVVSGMTPFHEVTPGPIKAVLRIQGEARLGAPAASGEPPPKRPYCLVFYGSSTIARAGRQERALVEVPTLPRLQRRVADGGRLDECEITGDTCSDGVDNDGDDHRDCLDPDCERFCPAGTSLAPAAPDAGADGARD
jgi:hypothetical protein